MHSFESLTFLPEFSRYWQETEDLRKYDWKEKREKCDPELRFISPGRGDNKIYRLGSAGSAS